jgi:aspartate kinase
LITFDDKYRIVPKTYDDIAKALSDENQLYVLPGFYGSNLRFN